MEKQNFLEEGKVYFTSISNLSSYGFYNIYGEGLNHTIKAISLSSGIKTNDYISRNVKDKDFLIAVKYLGNGLFEEMTTHEKLLASSSYVYLMESGTINLKGYETSKFISPDYEDYLKFLTPLNLTKEEHTKRLYDDIKLASEYPLTLSECLFIYNVDENSKQQYIKNSEEEREKIIENAKKKALSDSKKFIVAIHDSIVKDFNKESSNMQIKDLDSKISDFEGKERLR